LLNKIYGAKIKREESPKKMRIRRCGQESRENQLEEGIESE
jgi:hypothetical protein